jgi:arylsulfatase A-like enzyme
LNQGQRFLPPIRQSIVPLSFLRTGRLSTPAAGAVLGVLCGVIDCFVHETWVHLQSEPFEPIVIVFTWIIACGTAGLVFSSAIFGRLRWFVLAIAGPGVLLLARGATPFKQMTGWSSARILVVWFVVTLMIGAALSFIPLAKTRHALAYTLSMLFGVAVVVYAAADIRLADWFSSGAPTASNQRNVLLIFLDTTRADDALETTPPAMPRLARFAAGATNFTNAYAPASWTVPSHFAVLTGANWWRVSSGDRGFEYDNPRLPEQFRDHGYDTAAIFANPLLSVEARFSKGFAEFTTSRSSGVCHSGIGELMYRVLLNDGPRLPLCGWFTAAEVTVRAQRYIQRAHRPYMLAVNYLDTHDPYYVPPECRPAGFQRVGRADREALTTANPELRPPNAAIVSSARAQYRLAMSCMDRSLGALLDTASRDPNTVIAIVGDHGEEFLEHGHGSHGLDVYRETIHVPLVLRVPGVPPQTVAAPVSITDLYASLLRAAGVFRGGDALPLLNAAKRRNVVSMFELFGTPNHPQMLVRGYSVVSGDYQFILWPQHGEVLYDYRHDPAEAHPLDIASMPAVAAPMRQLAVRVARDKQRALQFSAVGYMR